MVHAAVRDEEHFAARHLAVDDAHHVDAAFADEVAAQFQRQFRLRQRGRQFVDFRCAAIGAKSSLSSPGKYGMPKPPPMSTWRTGTGAASARRSTRGTSSASMPNGLNGVVYWSYCVVMLRSCAG
jgi:hypothetical protein